MPGACKPKCNISHRLFGNKTFGRYEECQGPCDNARHAPVPMSELHLILGIFMPRSDAIQLDEWLPDSTSEVPPVLSELLAAWPPPVGASFADA